jgi:ATP-dependent Clp protease, protease subunit
MAQLLHLEATDPTRTSTSTSTRPGGSITSLMAIYDTMHFIKPERGHDTAWARRRRRRRCCSPPGPRASGSRLPHARVMLHQPHGGLEGQATDIEIQAREIIRDARGDERDPRQPHRPELEKVRRTTPTATSG